MVIIFILLALLTYRVNRSITDWPEKKRFIILLLIVASIISVSLAVFQTELKISGYEMGTAGSDMDVYYAKQLESYNEGKYFDALFTDTHAAGFIVWGTLIQLLSISESVIWIKICNILVLLHLMLSLYILLRKKGVADKISLLAVSFVSLDGILIWASIRNLRDIIIAFLMVESILIMENIFDKRKFNIKYVLPLILIMLILSSFRLFTVFYIFAVFVIYLYNNIKSKQIRLLGITTSILAGFLIFNVSFMNNVGAYRYTGIARYVAANNQRSELSDTLQSGSIIQRLVLGSIRYIFVPTPLSHLSSTLCEDLQVNKPGFYIGATGIFWLIEATFLWWLLLPLFFLAIIDKNYWKNSAFLSLLVIVFLYLIVYGYIYAGATGSRQRIPLHITGIIFAVTKLTTTDPKKIMSYYPLIAIPLFVASCLWALMIQ